MAPATILKTLKCRRCGHTWESKLLRPKCCPACKTYFWDKERVA